jgi:hypothetical protein
VIAGIYPLQHGAYSRYGKNRTLSLAGQTTQLSGFPENAMELYSDNRKELMAAFTGESMFGFDSLSRALLPVQIR